MHFWRVVCASVAQLVERLICNQRVGGSNPFAGFGSGTGPIKTLLFGQGRWVSEPRYGQVPKWPNGAGCKPAAETLRRFESFPAHWRGNSSVVERRPSKPLVAGSNPVSRFSAGGEAHVAQLVEHILGKDGVTSSTLVVGSAHMNWRKFSRKEVRNGEGKV
jgi:hypothetical protein